MMELNTVYPYGLNNRYGDEYKTENTYINVAEIFHQYLRDITELVVEVFIKVSLDFHHMSLTTNLIPCWKLISEMCLTLRERLLLA